MLRKGDTRLKKLMDEVIARAQSNGTALKSYNKWFMSQIPPNNVNLEYELSNSMKLLFASPNDKAFP
jgi:glutamate/aspartate transport system substrate-binding protein